MSERRTNRFSVPLPISKWVEEDNEREPDRRSKASQKTRGSLVNLGEYGETTTDERRPRSVPLLHPPSLVYPETSFSRSERVIHQVMMEIPRRPPSGIPTTSRTPRQSNGYIPAILNPSGTSMQTPPSRTQKSTYQGWLAGLKNTLKWRTQSKRQPVGNSRTHWAAVSLMILFSTTGIICTSTKYPH